MKNDKAQSEADARKKIQMIENRLESGDDFSQVAMNYSEQPDTAGNGGDMGMISESQLRTNPEIYAAVSKLKPGEISHPLPMVDPATKKTIGYSIVRLISKEPAGQRELNDPRVQQFIREQLRDGREQLLKAAYYDAVHLPHVLIALDHRKPVLCEKPMAMNSAECEHMVAAAERAHVPLGVAQNFRFEPSVNRLREIVAAGTIGKPLLARSEFHYYM